MMEFVYAYAYFILYAFLGWVCEDLYCGIPAKKFINRGFFYGPYCPIYGVGALLVLYPLLFVKDYPILVFILGVIITSTLEYIAVFYRQKQQCKYQSNDRKQQHPFSIFPHFSPKSDHLKKNKYRQKDFKYG
jgi:uncharacterized membrane protein